MDFEEYIWYMRYVSVSIVSMALIHLSGDVILGHQLQKFKVSHLINLKTEKIEFCEIWILYL